MQDKLVPLLLQTICRQSVRSPEGGWSYHSGICQSTVEYACLQTDRDYRVPVSVSMHEAKNMSLAYRNPKVRSGWQFSQMRGMHDLPGCPGFRTNHKVVTC